MNAFSEALRQEFTEQDAREAVIGPGCVATGLAGHITDPAIRAVAKGMDASMRTLRPEDSAAVIVYAVSRAEHIAGQIDPQPTDQAR
ncbi:hypothetical protein ABZX95_32645 [Streptomyces sp. NPDC004232]|uniref:hypothetical protein n=1 Tax=Streptomyces sp. NPDC004232 TaxID=3154454 RepID=UPI001DEEEDDB|nr:hypothetical protein [Streptomyces sp. tea 10]